MLQLLWVLCHWDDWETLIILAVPFQLYALCFMSISMLIFRFRGRIPYLITCVLAFVIAGWPAANVLWATLPYSLDYKDYRENLRQVREQERLQQKLAATDVDKQPVQLAGGMAGLESMKIFMALVSYRANSKQPQESDQQPEDKEFLQTQKTSQTVDVQSVSNPENALGEVSDSSGRR